jgi:transcription antitermination factor NusG
MPILHAEPDIFPTDLLVDSDAEPSRTWWVLQTLSRQEKRLCRLLLRQQISFYCPTVANPYRSPGGRIRTSHLPLFPNYVFLQGDEEHRYRSVTTGCVSRCLPVADGGQLLAELRQIKRLIDLGVPLNPEEQFAAGALVRVKSGPMSGLEGRVLQRHGERRLLIAVNFIQRGASLELGDWELERVL